MHIDSSLFHYPKAHAHGLGNSSYKDFKFSLGLVFKNVYAVTWKKINANVKSDNDIYILHEKN